jgi:hypothetical protein
MLAMVAVFPQLVVSAKNELTVWDAPAEFVDGGSAPASADEAIRVMEDIAHDLHNAQKSAGAE